MQTKKRLLKIAIIVMLIFITSLSMTDSYAYWNNIISPTDTIVSGSVTTGTWDQIYAWDANVAYIIGDQVTFNGSTWIATKAHSGKTPSTSAPGSNFWSLV